jgi:tetratricopeptide (TPR) repeat protein
LSLLSITNYFKNFENIGYSLIYSLILIIFLLSPITIFSSKTESISEKIQDLYYSFDTLKINETISGLDSSIFGKDDIDLFYYYKGFLFHHSGKVRYVNNPEEALNDFYRANEYFEKAIETKPKAEYFSLLSSSYGKTASLSPLSAIYWGWKAKTEMDNALELDSTNSKVLLIVAIHLMHIPESFGGDKKKARELLEKAFDNISSEEKMIDWAKKAEIYAYLAQVEILDENINLAEEYMKKSLELSPDYDFVRIDLRRQIQSLGK